MLLGAAAVAACSGTGPRRHLPEVLDGPGADAPRPVDCELCNIRTQTGCDPGQKCLWAIDATMPMPAGHIECAPDGTVPVGGTCTYGPFVPPDPQSCVSGSYDDCIKGSQCWNGVCEQICDPQGGLPTCNAGMTCVTHDGLLEYNGTFVAGVCE